MMTVRVSVDATDAKSFFVEITGQLKRPKALNDALGRRLARELQGHFRAKNRVPNKMAAPKTNFWKDVAEATSMTVATDAGAIVTIAEDRFAIHLYGGTIKPTGGRSALTIPLIPEARAKRAREYEASTGRKLFRVGRVLMERTATATAPALTPQKVTVLRNGTYRKINSSAKGGVRAVYALKPSVTIKADPLALPPQDKLIAALVDTAQKWVDRENLKSKTTLA